ncbi:uncharacterized protein LOC126762114 isoform X1 [Bactrocera neohumeralis]|uniref:uncharacterized protein LOC126762114 isoform X1 n=1 Tax=Bactrocera neohumeralis TaxID=98809 RepID=UPI0021660910|nr:uncharacterized protein LOC126762114 isoform X1 [Bactrocera neohumeralis]
MFSSINFLFLISLAVTTWIILCYFKQIEQQREDPMTIEVHMNNAYEDTLRGKACFENYDIYLNFLAIFACIYALAKVTTYAENYVAQQVNARFKLMKLPSSRPLEPTNMEELHTQHMQLTLQIDFLEKENAKLAQQVKQLEQTNFILGAHKYRSNTAPTSAMRLLANVDNNQMPQECHKTATNGVLHTLNSNAVGNAVGGVAVTCNHTEAVNTDMDGEMANNVPDGFAAAGGLFCFRNVIIQDNHFQRTRQVYVNEGNVKLQFQDFNQEGDHITQIWQKYLEMQKYALQKPTAPHSATQVANAVPIVVSTEELQTMQGTDQLRGKRQPRRITHAIVPTGSATKHLNKTHTTAHTPMHIPQTTLTLPIQIYYKNLLICLLCWCF